MNNQKSQPFEIIMLKLFDQNNEEITDERQRQYCNNSACPGEPWCSAWGTCIETAALEPQQQAIMEDEINSGSGLEFDLISALLDSPTPLSEPHSNSTIPEHHPSSKCQPSQSIPTRSHNRFIHVLQSQKPTVRC